MNSKKYYMEVHMKGKNKWACFLMILSGIVIGGFIGTMFPDSFLNYGQNFGLSNPLQLDLGILVITFGLTIKITVSSVLGIVLGILVYRLL